MVAHNSNVRIQNFSFFNSSNGFLTIQNSNLKISNSLFNNSIVGQILQNQNMNPLISLLQNNNNLIIKIFNSSFIGFKAATNGSIFVIFNINAVITIKNCSFSQNKVNMFGGAIYIYDSSNITIMLCKFINNAAQYGGSIYYSNEIKNSLNNVNIVSNIFQNDYAQISGGSLMFFSNLPKNFETSNNSFIGNKADLYGDDFASEPYRILFLGDRKVEKKYDIENFRNIPFTTLKSSSGNIIDKILKFAIVDIFYQTVTKNFVE